MDDWDNFYMLAGGTAGTLIGLIFVVITLGMDHAQEGDTLRIRIFVTPILVYFVSLLVIAMVMVPPMAPLARAVSLGAIGCAGIAYVLHVAHLSRTEAKTDEQELVWDVLLPLASFVLTVIAADCVGARSVVRQQLQRHRRGDPAGHGAAQELDRDPRHRHPRLTQRQKEARQPGWAPRLFKLGRPRGLDRPATCWIAALA